jgi:hypothetical protein
MTLLERIARVEADLRALKAAHASTASLAARRSPLIAYLRAKTDEGDWHAVSDAANDLRVLEAQSASNKRMTDTIDRVDYEYREMLRRLVGPLK